jgi:dUTP pyrophosphatase
MPVKGSEFAAGYDLAAAENKTVPARGKAIIKTGLAIKVPYGCYGRIAPRSGLSWKNHLDVGAGVCDTDFTGEYGVILFNHSETDFEVKIGDRIAQLILEKIEPDAAVEEVAELPATKRGEGGFGSTGISVGDHNLNGFVFPIRNIAH